MMSNFGFFGLAGLSALITVIIIVLILIFEIAMLVSAIRNDRITTNVKALWIIGMLLLHPFVAIAYYFTDYDK